MQKQFQLKHTFPIFVVYNPHFDVKVEFTFFAKKKNIALQTLSTHFRRRSEYIVMKKIKHSFLSVFFVISE